MRMVALHPQPCAGEDGVEVRDLNDDQGKVAAIIAAIRGNFFF